MNSDPDEYRPPSILKKPGNLRECKSIVSNVIFSLNVLYAAYPLCVLKVGTVYDLAVYTRLAQYSCQSMIPREYWEQSLKLESKRIQLAVSIECIC